MKRVGFIGLGNMGFPMARNILRTGIEINAFDLSDDAMQKANELGMKAKRSAKEVLEDIDALITMLPNDAAVENVFLKENLLEEIKDNIIMIESSTINPQVAKKVSAKAFLKIIKPPVANCFFPPKRILEKSLIVTFALAPSSS